MARLIPHKQQWRKWSLPSKFSAIGLLLAVIALPFAWLLYWMGPSVEKQDRGLQNDQALLGVTRETKDNTELLLKKQGIASPSQMTAAATELHRALMEAFALRQHGTKEFKLIGLEDTNR